MTSNVLIVTDENHKRYIFPILPVNVPRSYFDLANVTSDKTEVLIAKRPCVADTRHTSTDSFLIKSRSSDNRGYFRLKLEMM